ncbi:tripartite motif-containing protein 16-like [Poecilia formosa]|uniref:tripartite motif-containing protein 16-like n=1 Tax=Poecilia formosa TaxID=48698 RepID=UPI0007B8EF9F|nr:PREDICTED: tripartite motif-containing protein 16-like [Poecilia formosa]
MAERGNKIDSGKYSCSTCGDLLKDPVTIPCGHSYCMNCIKDHWDGEDQMEVHSCPQCRKEFNPRPNLEKNFMLAELVEDLKKSGLQAAAADHCYAGPEDVACDVCTGRKMKAAKSCLVCLITYCENHLQPHYQLSAFKKHKLVNPSKTLQDSICSHHEEVMKIFCRTDQQCICYLCLMDEHKGHETVPAAAERAEKQKELQESRQQIHQRIQDQEEDVKLLQQEVEAINVSADKAVEDSEKIFTELIRLLQERSSEVKQQIRSQQETEVSRVKDVQEKLEQEITELKRKDAELEQLSHTEDHTQFLLNYPSLPALRESTHSSSINIRPLRHFEDVTAAVTELRDKLQDVLRDLTTNISLTVNEVNVLLSEPEPKTRDGFLKYSQEITLDPNTEHKKLFLSEIQPQKNFNDVTATVSEVRDKTQDVPGDTTSDLQPKSEREPKTRAGFLKFSQIITLDPNTLNRFLLLSEGNRKVTFVNHEQFYPDHPDRFDGLCYQVLSTESLTECCYWEVEWRGGGAVAVSYKNISRTERLGSDDQSWSLFFDQNSYTFYHNNIKTPLARPVSSRIGVYLDHTAGILSFYSVSKTLTLIHRVQTRFTQPLYVGIRVYFSFSCPDGSSAEFIKPE